MRLENYLDNKFDVLEGLIILTDTPELNEMPDSVMLLIKDLGKKAGIKVKKTNTIFHYLGKAGKATTDLLKYATLYSITDIKDKEKRASLVKDMKGAMQKVDKRDISSFFMRLDKAAFGLTSIPRAVLMNLFGIEVGTPGSWMEDKAYIQTRLNNVRITLKRMGDTEKELKILDRLEKSIGAL